MDRETTQRLLRECVIFLCKTHLGLDARSGFEVDAIICVSRRCDADVADSYSDPRPIVFKFHECVADEDGKAAENSNDWLSAGSSKSFISGLVRHLDWAESPASKKRKTGEENDHAVLSYYSRFGTDGIQTAEHVPDLSLVKQESSCTETEVLNFSDAKNCAQTDTLADQSLGMRPADATSFDVCFGRNQSETAGAKEPFNTSHNSKLAVGISALEKMVSQPVMSTPPPLKIMPGAVDPRKSSSAEDCTKRPASRCSNGESRSEIIGDMVAENLDDSANGLEQSTPRNCDLCGLVFADFPSFNVHCATLHSRYACPFCDLSFPCESTRERHLFEHTGESVDDDGVDIVPGEEDDSRGSTRPSGHPEFAKRSSTYWSADASGPMEMSDSEDGASAVNGTLYDPQVVTRRGVLSCQTLRAIAQLDPSHPFVCDVCRARFCGSSELCDHTTSVHHRIPCPFCGRSFSQKASMERHQRQHTGERPYACTLCDSSYTRKENLQTHMTRMHGAASSGSDFICIE